MFLPWSEFVAFLNTSLVELVETEFAQVRYGDVGLAFWLTTLFGLAAVATLARLLFRRRKYSREHSGHTIDPK